MVPSLPWQYCRMVGRSFRTPLRKSLTTMSSSSWNSWVFRGLWATRCGRSLRVRCVQSRCGYGRERQAPRFSPASGHRKAPPLGGSGAQQMAERNFGHSDLLVRTEFAQGGRCRGQLEHILHQPALGTSGFQRQVGQNGAGMVLLRLIHQLAGPAWVLSGAAQVIAAPALGASSRRMRRSLYNTEAPNTYAFCIRSL